MKKLMCLFVLLCASSARAEQNFGSIVGISVIPSTNWKSGQFVSREDYLNLDFDTTQFTSYEGALWHKSGISLGVQADVDGNAVGRVQKFLGYLGYKNFMLRMQTGDLRGTANWNGPATSGQPSSVKFESKYSSVDILKWGKSDFYYGFGYASYEIPMQVNTEVLNGSGEIVYGKEVYDDAVPVKSYAFLFGFDTMQKALMSENTGFGFWAYTQDRFGLGTMDLSDKAITRAETANPGRRAMSDNLFSGMVDYDLTLGVYWTGKAKSAKLSFGTGYSFSGETVIPFGGGQLSNTSQIRLAPIPYIYRHGLVFKGSVRW
ncbi:MAG TPA: hypothetical protein PLL10_08405 [Elusimicrobiales bacterium]|nr:hypothetical protein [Elusimicrobiales bacterium]